MRADFTTPAAAFAPDMAFASGRLPPPSPPSRRRPAPPQRSAGDRLREALMALGDFHGQVLSHHEKAWASVTFAGARHTLILLFAGDEAVEAGERFLAELPDHEFAIPGHIVADAAITEADHRLHPAPQLAVTCELLLLEEG